MRYADDKMRTVEIEIKNIYGVEKYYPKCDKAKLFTKMLGQSTLTERDVSVIKQLGYEVVSLAQEIKL
jgi:hypothetical protein